MSKKKKKGNSSKKVYKSEGIEIKELHIKAIISSKKKDKISSDTERMIQKYLMLLDTQNGMNEMGEMENMRLQMAMDRLSKMMEILSNMLKKMSQTASEITQNIK